MPCWHHTNWLTPPSITVRISPAAVLIDREVYGENTHLHEFLHLTQKFVGPANELEAYGLNVRSDPRFLLLNFPYFEDVVKTFFMPDLPKVLNNFFSRPIKEKLNVPREVQWFLAPFDPGALDRLQRAIEKMEPLLSEVERLNRAHPKTTAYLSEQNGKLRPNIGNCGGQTSHPPRLRSTG